MKLSVIGHEVGKAWEPEQAFTTTKADCPKLILLDLALPDIDGLALLCRARNRSRHVSHPHRRSYLIPRKYPKAAALAAGCDAYLVKPIDTREPSSQLTDVAERRDAGD
jgi:DNA-binding response OmpR family regulator